MQGNKTILVNVILGALLALSKATGWAWLTPELLLEVALASNLILRVVTQTPIGKSKVVGQAGAVLASLVAVMTLVVSTGASVDLTVEPTADPAVESTDADVPGLPDVEIPPVAPDVIDDATSQEPDATPAAIVDVQESGLGVWALATAVVLALFALPAFYSNRLAGLLVIGALATGCCTFRETAQREENRANACLRLIRLERCVAANGVQLADDACEQRRAEVKSYLELMDWNCESIDP